MTVSKKLIENVKELRKSLNEISVYDFDVYTSMELYYKIANKLNEVIKELMRFEGLVSDEVVEQNEKLIYLIGEGLNIEVVKKINQMVQNGTMDSIINHKVFNSLNNKVDEYKEELSSQIKDIENNKADKKMIGSPLVANVSSEMVDINRIYVYTGTEDGFINGNWYYNDQGVWKSGGTYNAMAVGQKTIEPNQTTFVKELNLAKYKYLIKNATITVNSSNIGTYSESSSKNKVVILKVEKNTTYIITKKATKYFEAMCTTNIPSNGDTSSTVKKYLSDDKTKIIIDTQNNNYLSIWLYNADNDSDLNEILDSLIVCKEDDYKYNDKSILEDIIVNRENLSEDLQDYLFEEKGKLVNKYYATVRANSSCDYTNELVSIKVNFEKGECKSEKHLKVFRNGVEYEFEFIPCQSDNVINVKNNGYWNDNSLRSGEIIFIESILSGTKNTYEICLYDEEQTNNFRKKIDTEINDNKNVTFKTSDNSIMFAENRKYGLRLLNSIDFENRDYINVDGNIIELLASQTTANYSYSISGQGIVYKCLSRKLQYGNIIELVSDTYFYSNNEIVQKSYFKTLTPTSENYIQTMITELRVPVTSYNSVVSSTYHTDFIFDGKKGSLCCLYANGEERRTPTSSEIHLPSFAGETSADSNTKTGFQFGFKYSGVTRFSIPKDKIISTCWAFKLNSDESYYLRKFNPLVGIASNKNKYQSKQLLKNKLFAHIEFISECWDKYKSNNPSSYNLTNTSIHQKFWLYKHKNQYTFDSVVNDFKTVMNNVFGGNSVTSFENVYNNGTGLEYTGRWITCAWLLYKEALELNKLQEIEYFKTTLLNYATFIKNICDVKNDIPLQYTGTEGNGNSRSMGLRALCMGEYLAPDTYNETIEKILGIMSGYVRGENYIPDLPNIVKCRTLHYWVFAHYYYERARKLVNFSNILKNSSQICLDAVNSNGEPKDMTWCNLNSRRGCEQTFAYIIGTLLSSGDYGDVEQANRVADNLISGDFPIGTQQFPLNGFLASSEVSYHLQLFISLNDMIDVFEEFFE